MKNSLLCIVVSVAALSGTILAYGSDDTPAASQKETLRELGLVQVIVEDLSPELVRKGLRAEELQGDIERRLRDAGIKVYSSPAHLLLRIDTAGIVPDSLAYSIRFQLRLPVQLVGQEMRTTATTWERSAVGVVSERGLRSIRKSVSDMVDDFTRDYLAVKARGAAGQTLQREAAETDKQGASITRNAAVRSGPGGVHDKLGTLAVGTRIQILEERNGWYRFSDKSFPDGWVHKAFTDKAY